MAKKKSKVGLKVPSLKELQSRYGNSLLLKASEKSDHGLYIPFRMFALTYLFGKGLPYGKVVEIIGEENSGKTLAALDLAYTTQQLGGHVIWIDAEQSWDNAWAEKNGVDPDAVSLVNDTQIETIADAAADLPVYWRSKLVNNEPILLVIDSVAALDSAETIDSKMTDGKSEMGTRAKAIGKMLRIRNELWYKLGITVVCINQHRKKIGVMFGDDNTTPGGKAMAFFASIRVSFIGSKQLTTKYKGKDRREGKLVTIRVVKNKVAPARTTLKGVPIYFTDQYNNRDIGFERLFGFEDVLTENDIIDKKAGSYRYRGELIARGEDKFKALLSEDDKLRRKLLRKAGIVTIGSMRKSLEELNTNLFPVESDDTEYESYTGSNDEEEDSEE